MSDQIEEGWYGLGGSGGAVYLDADGDVLGQVDADGDAIEPADEYAVSDGVIFDPRELVDEPSDRAQELEERMLELERQTEEMASRPLPSEVMITTGIEEADLARLDKDMKAQVEHMQHLLGRPLTLAEGKRILHEAYDAVEAGDARLDLLGAADRLAQQGQPLHDLDNEHPLKAHEQRVAFMTQRLEDRERLAADERGEDDVSSDVRPPSRQYFDMDDDAQRRDYLNERLTGQVADEDAAAVRYSSSSDLAEQ